MALVLFFQKKCVRDADKNFFDVIFKILLFFGITLSIFTKYTLINQHITKK